MSLLGCALALALAAQAGPAPAAGGPPGRHFEVERHGSGAPEVLVWFGPELPTAEQLGWRRQLGERLEDQLAPGTGSVHLVIDLGPRGDSPRGFADDFPSSRADPTEPECLTRTDTRAFASYLVGHPGIVGLALVEGDPSRVSDSPAGQALEQPEAVYPQPDPMHAPVVDFGQLTGFEAFHVVGLGIKSKTLDWRPRGAEDALDRALPSLLEALRSARAGLSLGASAATHLGGDLWQLDLEFSAPELGQIRPDPERTYPLDRLELALTSPVEGPDGATPAPPEAPAPELVDLAWSSPGAAAFERLGMRDGRFAFPGGELPPAATLRLIARLPAGSDSVAVQLDAGRAGQIELVLPLGGE